MWGKWRYQYFVKYFPACISGGFNGRKISPWVKIDVCGECIWDLGNYVSGKIWPGIRDGGDSIKKDLNSRALKYLLEIFWKLSVSDFENFNWKISGSKKLILLVYNTYRNEDIKYWDRYITISRTQVFKYTAK